MIKAIAFDWDGVIETRQGGLISSIVEYLGVKKEDWRRQYFSLNYLCNTGQKSYEEVYGMSAKNLGATDEQVAHVHELMRENRKTRKINIELVEMIKKLKQNYKIGLMSNNYKTLRQEIIDVGLIDLFDAVIISAEVGYQKPQPEIFDILFKKLGVEANEVVFTDDTAVSLEGADKIGYIPILFKDNETFKKELVNLGIKI